MEQANTNQHKLEIVMINKYKTQSDQQKNRSKKKETANMIQNTLGTQIDANCTYHIVFETMISVRQKNIRDIYTVNNNHIHVHFLLLYGAKLIFSHSKEHKKMFVVA